MTMQSEDARRWIHVGVAALALLLRELTWWQAASLAAAALAFNLIVLPKIGGRRLYRAVGQVHGYPVGIVVYPLAVLLLIVAFPARPDITAAAWGVLAFGDGAATLVGRRAAGRRLPWNHEKTIAGSIGFVVFGGLGAVALAWWMRAAVAPLPSWRFTILAPAAAAAVAALVETVPIRLDDNVSVPIAAGAVLWTASLMTRSAATAAEPAIVSALPLAAAVNAAVAWIGHRARTVSASGAIVGAAIGVVIYAGAGRGAWLLLLATFCVASIASRLGLDRKLMLGIAEERGGRRGAGNAIANCGVAAIAAIAVSTTPDAPTALVALTAALAAGGSDTVASEIGKAWGRSTILVTSLRRVKPGTPGAMSLEGTAAGLIAAFGLAACATLLGLISGGAILPVVVAATAGAVVESLLAAMLEESGLLNNDVLNFINTAVAAAVAMTIA